MFPSSRQQRYTLLVDVSSLGQRQKRRIEVSASERSDDRAWSAELTRAAHEELKAAGIVRGPVEFDVWDGEFQEWVALSSRAQLANSRGQLRAVAVPVPHADDGAQDGVSVATAFAVGEAGDVGAAAAAVTTATRVAAAPHLPAWRLMAVVQTDHLAAAVVQRAWRAWRARRELQCRRAAAAAAPRSAVAPAVHASAFSRGRAAGGGMLLAVLAIFLALVVFARMLPPSGSGSVVADTDAKQQCERPSPELGDALEDASRAAAQARATVGAAAGMSALVREAALSMDRMRLMLDPAASVSVDAAGSRDARASARRAAPKKKRVAVYLLNDAANTQRHVASALRAVFPTWSDSTAQAVMLEAHRHGRARCGAPLDDARDASRVVAALRAYRVRAEAEVVDEQRETAGASLLPRSRW